MPEKVKLAHHVPMGQYGIVRTRMAGSDMANLGGRARTFSLIAVLVVTLLGVGVLFGVRSARPSASRPSTAGSGGTRVPSRVVDPAAQAVQGKLDRSLQKMLDSVLGPGNSTVVTTAELRPSASSSIPDPAVAALGSSHAEAAPGDGMTRNNAINQVDEVRSSEPGLMMRLDVVVRIFPGASATIDLAQVERMVSAAAGIDPSRGDTITVTVAPR
ncbi:flagellar M-ring protein FliF C-terminal domain-containing protein [Actinoplanes sp. NPDC049265]|uniref:flagellar M-ring protein FliF C-terminal domain-containing protein n=1 Tax=Actinoplanes sp. NPDC049265 TaxID=3363902 RepID=UPI003723EFED